MVYQNDIAINMDAPSDNTSTGHAQLTEEPEKVDVLSVDIASSTKDSVRVKWRILQDYVANVQGTSYRLSKFTQCICFHNIKEIGMWKSLIKSKVSDYVASFQCIFFILHVYVVLFYALYFI